MELKEGYRLTEAGVIPADWIVKPLLTAVRVASGQVDPRNEPFRSMVLVAPDHIESATGRLLNKVSAGDQHAISGKYLFAAGDIVYSKIRPYLRKAILADFPGLCSADMYPLKPTADVSGGFVLASILAHQFSTYAESVSVRSGMPKINRGELAEYSMAFPPTKAEQEAIAEALCDADALIESLDQLLTKKSQIKQGTMQELLTGKRRLPGFSGEWEVKKLGSVADVIDPHPSHRAPNEVSNGVPFLGIGDLDESGEIIGKKLRLVDFPIIEEHARRYNLDDELIGLGRVASIGKVVKLKKYADGYAISPTLGVIRGRDAKRCYLLYALGSKFVTEQFTKIMSGSTRSSVGMEVLRELHIQLPPSEKEQTAIATILSDMDTELSALESRLAKARQIKQGMMQELLTGRIRLL